MIELIAHYRAAVLNSERSWRDLLDAAQHGTNEEMDAARNDYNQSVLDESQAEEAIMKMR